jgi:hypothetical protein
MSRGAAFAGAALALAALPLLAEPGSAAIVEIHSPLDPEWISNSDGSMLQSDPADGRVTVDKVSSDGPVGTGDRLRPDPFALKEIGGSAGNFDAVSSVATPEPSVLTRLLLIFADLRATVFRSPAAGP